MRERSRPPIHTSRSSALSFVACSSHAPCPGCTRVGPRPLPWDGGRTTGAGAAGWGGACDRGVPAKVSNVRVGASAGAKGRERTVADGGVDVWRGLAEERCAARSRRAGNATAESCPTT
jgi:hypothetical protein